MTARNALARAAARKPARPGRRRLLRAAAVLLMAVPGLLALAGCDPRMALYFLQPFEPTVSAEGPSLKDKRVVVITKAVPGALYDFATLDRELTREFVSLIRAKHGKRVDIVDTDKVYAWDQAHPSWTDAAELAEAFDADLVIFLELAQFQIQDPSTPEMYQGQSSVHIHVVERAHPNNDRGKPMTDLPKETKVSYTADKDTVFPIHNPMPVSAEVSATAFKTKFLKLVATEISWHFVDHAPGDNIQDTNFTGR